MKRKLLKAVGIVCLLLVITVIAAPFFLRGKISEVIKNKVNANINGTFDFADADLQLFDDFPNATVVLEEVSIINHAPFEGDTLFSGKKIILRMSLNELFKGTEDPISVQELQLDEATIAIKVDAAENANYDIAKQAEEELEDETGSDGFAFNLDEYAVSNSKIVYDDIPGGIHLEIDRMNHKGTGDLSLTETELDTHTDALVSFALDSTTYLKRNAIQLDAKVQLDLEKNRYTFLDNKALINQLPLIFEGYVELQEEDQEIDMAFNTPSSDFKNFLGIIPKSYSQNIENVATTGNFEVHGELKGKVDETHIPTFKIKLFSDNASFKYPDLPKKVENVFIDTEINNDTGIAEDTYVVVKRLAFGIDQDNFELHSKITDLLGNTKVDADIKGKINLQNLAQAYPVPDEYDIQGVLNADLSTHFDMASVENKKYENTRTQGLLQLKDFNYDSDELKHPVSISDLQMKFDPKRVKLNTLKGQTGQTDFDISGSLDNVLGLVFNKEKIKGNFLLSSKIFALDDFLVEESEATEVAGQNDETPSTLGESIKIPSFLDCTINAKADTVIYDDLKLKKMSGTLVIQDETAELQSLKSGLLDGKLSLSGLVSTKNPISEFSMNIGIDGFDVQGAFESIELLKVLAPVAEALEGKLNSDFKLFGNLNTDMTPNLETLSGSVLAKILGGKIKSTLAPVLTGLKNQINFIDVDKLKLKDLGTAFSFKDGRVDVKPFTLGYKDFDIRFEGKHTFDGKLEYNATMEIPITQLSGKVNELLAQIDDPDLEKITIPVSATLGGSYLKPSVQTDLTSGITRVTNELIEVQKQKLKQKGKEKAADLLGLGDIFTPKDTVTTSGGIVANSGIKKDSIQVDTTVADTTEKKVKKTADSILGLFGQKKKDTVN